jgi:hypothetical protein
LRGGLFPITSHTSGVGLRIGMLLSALPAAPVCGCDQYIGMKHLPFDRHHRGRHWRPFALVMRGCRQGTTVA